MATRKPKERAYEAKDAPYNPAHPPVLLHINHVPEGVLHLHRLAGTGYADSYLKTQTEGMIVKCNISPVDVGNYPELAGIEQVWLVYSGRRAVLTL